MQLPKLFRLSLKPYRTFDTSTSKNIESLFRELVLLKDLTDTLSKKIFILKLSELILTYQNVFLDRCGITNEKNSIFDKFVGLLEENYKKSREVKYYADLLAIHPNHLNKIVHSCSDFSAKEYIQSRIFQEAKYLLSATGISIKEIASDLGFTDYNYFCRQFKRVVSQTPMQYKKNNV